MSQVNKAIIRINDFETTAAEIAIDKRYDYVICGHIHQPQKRVIENEQGSVVYLNSGDWVEHLTALEYHDHDWHLYEYEKSDLKTVDARELKRKNETEVITSEIALYLHSLGA
jgi:UDP-2,3-diacylglucosamine pyrophosphatase LpxH